MTQDSRQATVSKSFRYASLCDDLSHVWFCRLLELPVPLVSLKSAVPVLDVCCVVCLFLMVVVQLVAAVKKGDVEGVEKCLAVEGIDVNAKVDYETAADSLLSDECTADVRARLEIAVLLEKAGADTSANHIVSTDPNTPTYTRKHAALLLCRQERRPAGQRVFEAQGRRCQQMRPCSS